MSSDIQMITYDRPKYTAAFTRRQCKAVRLPRMGSTRTISRLLIMAETTQSR